MHTEFRVLLLALLLAAGLGSAAPPAAAQPVAPPAPPPLDPQPVAAGFDALQAETLPAEVLPPVEELGEVVVTATRVAAPEIAVPRAVNVVPSRRVQELGVTSVADALQYQTGVWVEKRTSHTSDPVMRGLSGSNLLALVDGNTLSTFYGEGGFAGDDMYGKIDSWSIDRIEVVRGPSSVLYGSNALGGVINFITKSSPFDYQPAGCVRWGTRSMIQANTAPSGWRLRQEVFGASSNWRWFAGVTRLDIGSTRDGSGQRQTPTAARGWYADAKLNWKITDSAYAEFAAQYANLDPVYRYYRPTQDNQNERLGLAGTLRLVDLDRHVGFADEARLTLYYQDKEDRRRWFDAATKEITQRGVATWETIQVDLQLEKEVGDHSLTYGLELESTWGESPDDEQFTITLPDGTTRKDAPDSIFSSLGGYVQDEWRLSDLFSLTGSVRVDVFRFETEVDEFYVPAGGLDPQVDEFTDWDTAVVGGLQATVHVDPATSIYGGWTRGFRYFAPRFGVTEHAWGVVVPNELLDPVTADQFELGLKHRSPYVTGDLVGYYTLLDNFQNVVRGEFLGQDWYDFNQNGMRDLNEDVYVYVGNGEAYVYGVEIYGDVNLAAIDRGVFGESWRVGAGFMWNYGQDETNDIPLRHTHPMRGLFKIRWEPPTTAPRLWAELVGTFTDRYDRIPPDRLSRDVGYLEDPQDPSLGMLREWGLPGYSVWDVRAGFLMTEDIEFTMGLQNIFDKLYRPAHARWDAPGRNFYATVSIRL